MAGGAPAETRWGVARRLLMMATAVMPPARRDWGRAMSAELPYTSSWGERARLVLSAARVVLLPPHGTAATLAAYGRAVSRAACLAAVACAPLCLALYLVNVVFRARQDSAFGVLAMDAYLILILAAAGALARRACPRPAAALLAGVAAGLVLGGLGTATFTLISAAYHPDAGLAIVASVVGAVVAPAGAAVTSVGGPGGRPPGGYDERPRCR
jgi:hypothetical protein